MKEGGAVNPPQFQERSMPYLTKEQQDDLDHAYGYHAPTPEQIKLYAAINEAAKNFETTVLLCCPSSADRSAAQRQIRDARMTANRSIALHKG